MKNPLIDYIKASIAIRPIFVCSRCSACSMGDTARYDLFALDASNLKEQIDKLQVSASHMPVGWGSFPNREFRCNRCLERI